MFFASKKNPCYICDFCDICGQFRVLLGFFFSKSWVLLDLLFLRFLRYLLVIFWHNFSQLFLLRQLRKTFASKFLLTRSILDISRLWRWRWGKAPWGRLIVFTTLPIFPLLLKSNMATVQTKILRAQLSEKCFRTTSSSWGTNAINGRCLEVYFGYTVQIFLFSVRSWRSSLYRYVWPTWFQMHRAARSM